MVGHEKSAAGHVCDLPPEVETLLLVIPGTSCTNKFRRWFRSKCLASSTNTQCLALLHSKAAINMERNRHINSYFWIIHPFSKMRTVWEIWMSFVFLLSFVIAPFTVTYNPNLTNVFDGFVMLELMVDAICLVDIFLSFSSGIFDYENQEIILSPFVIAKRYVLTYFFFDLLSSFPIEVVFNILGVTNIRRVYRYISLLNLLKVARIKTLYTYLNRTFQLFELNEIGKKLLRTALFCLLYYHWMACLCFLLAILIERQNKDDPNNRSWVTMAGLWEESEAIQYVHSMFHAVMEGNHVNYAHGAPTTTEDMLLTCLLGMIGTIIFIYFVCTALQILYIMNNAEFKYEEDTNQLKEFMRQKQLPEAFQKRLIDLNEFKFQRSFFREKNILNSLPGQLQQEILIHSCRHLVENVSFFNNLSSTMLVRLVMVLKSEIYLKNQEIIKIRTIGDCMFFLSSGTVAVYSASGREVCHMQDGSHFGEMALLNADRQRTASVVALEISEVYRLDRRDFNSIVAQFPDMVDQLKQIAAERSEQLQRLDVVI